ncbi:MAG: hypothetical protein R2779_10795 [Crocinitomicaceae bacterium]
MPVAGTFTYALTNVADPATGCNQNLTQNQVVVVNPMPTATIAGTTTVCQGYLQQLTLPLQELTQHQP